MLDEPGAHRLGAGLAQLEVALIVAAIVGVALDPDSADLRVRREGRPDVLEDLPGAGA